MSNLEKLKLELLDEVKAANDISALEDIKISALGKKGKITSMMRELGKLAPEERKAQGQALNLLKGEVAAELDAKITILKDSELERRLLEESIDITLPVRNYGKGTIHPISKTIEELTEIMTSMGFSVTDGAEIEDDFHNFTALNIPPAHPARQDQDTFYLPDVEGLTGSDAKRVLRTQTSNVQIHTMQNNEPPIRITTLGRVYRADSDMTHTPMFHQMEGLYIDKDVTMAHLKASIGEVVSRFFGIDNLNTRFRPNYFPFTEPSAEVDIQCSRKNSELKIGEGDDWLEILGAGMVNPKVLENCGIDSTIYQGFAFGFGVDRMAMLKYGIPDLRSFFDGDIRWLQHYGFGSADK